MKINMDMRCAIKAAEKCQIGLSWQQKKDAKDMALKKYLQKNPKLKGIEVLLKKKRAELHALEAEMAEHGLSNWGDGFSIANDDQFMKKGGLIKMPHKTWSFNQLMCKLAGADEVEGNKILKEHGIVWE